MDANSKLGPAIIEGDPHNQSENGKVLAGIIKRHALIVMNSVKNKCSGKITRKRTTKKVNEESIIDFIIVCDYVENMISKVDIDEDRKYILARYTKTKNGTKVKESDHHSMITYINTTWVKQCDTKRIEIYNFKDKDGLQKFKQMTSKDQFLSEVFNDPSKNINVTTKKCIKRLNFCLSQCFRKIRVKQTRRNKEMEDLFNRRRILRNKTNEASLDALDKIEDKLSEMCADDNKKTVEEECEGLACEKGGVNAGKLWQLKKKLRGIYNEPPTAMLDTHGNLVTSSKALEELTIETYIERLKILKIRDELSLHKMQREKVCDQRLQEARENKTPEWQMSDLDTVLTQLKKNKSTIHLVLQTNCFSLKTQDMMLKLQP